MRELRCNIDGQITLIAGESLAINNNEYNDLQSASSVLHVVHCLIKKISGNQLSWRSGKD